MPSGPQQQIGPGRRFWVYRGLGRDVQNGNPGYKSFHYQAGSWTLPRRVVAKVEHHAGELFPRVGFIVTNLQLPSRAVVRFYNKRGTAEQWIKEGKQAAHWTRLSCHRFRGNEVRYKGSGPGNPIGQSVSHDWGNDAVLLTRPCFKPGRKRPVGDPPRIRTTR